MRPRDDRAIDEVVGQALRGDLSAFDRIDEPLRSIARQRYEARSHDTPQAREAERVRRERAELGLDT